MALVIVPILGPRGARLATEASLPVGQAVAAALRTARSASGLGSSSRRRPIAAGAPPRRLRAAPAIQARRALQRPSALPSCVPFITRRRVVAA